MNLRSLCLVLAGVLAGCHHVPAPNPTEAVGPATRVVSPVLDEEVGQLFLERDGLWSYRVDDRSRLAGVERGQIVAFGNVEERGRKLFAVVGVHGWGARLQRLDVDPIAARTSGSIIPLSGLESHTASRWRFCTGTGVPQADDPCLSALPTGTQWHLYPLASATRVALDETPRTPLLPVPRLGIIGIHGTGADVFVPDAANVRWIAVPSTRRAPAVRPNLVAHASCRGRLPEDRGALGATWIFAEPKRATHPLTIESASWEMMADALIWCDEDRVTIAIPSLHRPALTTRAGVPTRPPAAGAIPFEFIPKNDASLQFAARAMGAASVGDFAVSELFLELFRRVDPSHEADELLLRAMEIAVAAGRPEAALHAGKAGTRRDWNPANSPWSELGMVAVEDALGLQKESLVRQSRIPELSARSGNDTLHAWLAFHQERQRARAERPARARSLERTLENYRTAELENWNLALRAEIARLQDRTSDLEALETEFAEAGAAPLWRAYLKRDVAKSCSDGCPLDAYGRRFASWLEAHTDEPAQLVRAPRATLAPGYAQSALTEGLRASNDLMHNLQLMIAAYPLLPSAQRAKLAQDLVSMAAAGVASGAVCAQEEEVARLRAIGSDIRRRLPDTGDATRDAEVVWLAHTAIPAVCRSPARLLAASQAFAERFGKAEAAAAILEADLQQASPETKRERLEAAAEFASRYERGARCKRWHLALAVALADVGRLEQAAEMIHRASACQNAYAAAENLVSAYVNYERTQSISPDFDRATQAQLEDVVLRKPAVDPALPCVGLMALDYALSPHVPEEIALLAASLGYEAAEPGELELVQASDYVDEGRRSLEEAARALEAGEPDKAASHLLDARSAFGTIRHAPGLARVRFLEEVVFGSDLEAHTEEGAKPPSRENAAAASLHQGQGRQILEEASDQVPDSHRRALIAASLLYDSLAQTLARVQKAGGPEKFPILCTQPPDAP